MVTSREIRLNSYPVGMPTSDNFELATVSVSDPQPGEVQVKNLWMSVDPYMRGRMVARVMLARRSLGSELTQRAEPIFHVKAERLMSPEYRQSESGRPFGRSRRVRRVDATPPGGAWETPSRRTTYALPLRACASARRRGSADEVT